MNKTVILPIISILAMIIKNMFHIEVGTEVQNAVADAILTLIITYGVIKDHTKKPS